MIVNRASNLSPINIDLNKNSEESFLISSKKKRKNTILNSVKIIIYNPNISIEILIRFGSFLRGEIMSNYPSKLIYSWKGFY